MPNHVTNRIIFKGPQSIVDAICTEHCIDFQKIVPFPVTMYRGDLSDGDSKDFPINWLSWGRENWGTKWNAYSGTVETTGDCHVLTFDTAWAPPFPVLAAFANIYQTPFEHRYAGEGEMIWGVDVWGKCEPSDNFIYRVSSRRNKKEDKS